MQVSIYPSKPIFPTLVVILIQHMVVVMSVRCLGCRRFSVTSWLLSSWYDVYLYEGDSYDQNIFYQRQEVIGIIIIIIMSNM